MKKLCYYHGSDFDGLACGALAYFHGMEIEPLEYGDTPEPRTDFFDVVFFADISNKPLMQSYLDLGSKVIWIDHHERTYNEMDIEGMEVHYDNKVSAAIGVFRFLRRDVVPLNLGEISRYDTWNHMGNTVHHHLGLLSRWKESAATAVDPSFVSMLLDESEYGDIVEDGRVVEAFNRALCTRMVQAHAFEEFIENIPCIVMNTDNAQVFFYGGTGNKSYRFGCTFYLKKPGLWTYSLRAFDKDFDVSAIAASFGGGGHRGAAGFATSTPLWS